VARKVEPLPGTSDIMPEDAAEWRLLEGTAYEVFSRYGYGELRTPIFERTDVFLHSIGEETDIVRKEMYTFEDRGGRSLTLRPEGTAGVMRALANAGIPQGDEKRVFYIGAMFRGERPAAGRKRQFHQIGVECVGRTAPEIDVESIDMLIRYLQTIDVTDTSLLLNTRGTKSDRQAVAQTFHDYFASHITAMCDDCKRRLDTNVWRILDCKNEPCQHPIDGAPPIDKLVSPESRDYFQRVCDGLVRLQIDFVLEPRLVRGLDYYNHTVFEVAFEGIGAQNALGGGGRYIIQLPGFSQPVNGVGFAMGMERIILAREQLGLTTREGITVDLYLVSLGGEALNQNMVLARQLRAAGYTVLMDLDGRGMKAQMRAANKHDARFALIRGDNELARDNIVCKNMADAEQQEIPLAELPDRIGRLLAK